MVILMAVIVSMFFYESFWRHPSADAGTISFEVQNGDGIRQIAGRLEEADLISYPFWFGLTARWTKTAGRIQIGTFALQRGLSSAAILFELARPGAGEISVTIPEGFTLQQVENLFISKSILSQPLSFSEDFFSRFSLLSSKPTEVSLEGYLFPDTYRFFQDTSAKKVVEKLLDNFDQQWTPEMRETAGASGRTIHEIVTLASIVEREVRTDADRAKVADLFWRRLEAGMPLQADSTVNYVTGKKTPSISNKDREIDSPWNTYKYSGLPPTPICNPGLAALKAALFPEPNGAWYFLTDAEGNVHYARTNEEQNVNKNLYLAR